MAEGIVNIYKSNGSMLGYFKDPKISQFGQDEYEIQGIFLNSDGQTANKLDFNPQALPYWAEIKNVNGIKHSQLTNVYVQRGRQPMVVTGLGS